MWWRPSHIEQRGDLTIRVGEKWEVEVHLLGPRPVVFWGVVGDAHDAGVQSFEFGSSVTELVTFANSAGCVGLHVPPEDRPPTMPVSAVNRVPVLIYRGEVRERYTWFEHLPIMASADLWSNPTIIVATEMGVWSPEPDR
jgi:hypothetical protein